MKAPCLLFILATLAHSAAGATTVAISDPGSPADAVRVLMDAYQTKDLDTYRAMLAPDFRFYPDRGEGRDALPVSLSRDEELRSAQHLFHGFVDGRGITRPAAVRIVVQWKRSRVWEPPPTWRRRIASVLLEQVVLTLDWPDGSSMSTDPVDHLFVLAASGTPAGGRSAWQVVQWRETPTTSQLANAGCSADTSDTGAPGPAPDSSSAAPAPVDPHAAFGIRPHANPVRASGVVRFGLPRRGDARLRIVDVAGRAVFRLDLSDLDPGEHEVRLADARLAPGVYWLSLEQTDSRAQTKIVLIE
jgi:hypothetical protein